MLVSSLIILTRSILLAGLADRGQTDVLVKQAFQPRQQGTPSGPTIFIHPKTHHRRGSPKRAYVWDPVAMTYSYTETELVESTFQISGLCAQSPATPTDPTTSDLVLTASDILQHNDALAAFTADNVGILRIMDITTVQFVNDSGQHDTNPVFDFVLTHSNIFTKPGIAVTRIRENIFSI